MRGLRKPQASEQTVSQSIVLIGFMGTGKSAIGRGIVRLTGWQHVDTDREIEQRLGMPIPRIFAEQGESAFRMAECAVLTDLAGDALATNYHFVVSTGGGTPLRKENAALLRKIGKIVWLKASLDVIVQRVTRKLDQRPLLAGFAENPRQRIEGLLSEREPQYAELAEYIIDTSTFPSPDDAARNVVKRLGLSEAL